jgi:hypothetical protein
VHAARCSQRLFIGDSLATDEIVRKGAEVVPLHRSPAAHWKAARQRLDAQHNGLARERDAPGI